MQEPTDLVVSGPYLNKTLESDVDPISLIGEFFQTSAERGLYRCCYAGVTDLIIDRSVQLSR